MYLSSAPNAVQRWSGPVLCWLLAVVLAIHGPLVFAADDGEWSEREKRIIQALSHATTPLSYPDTASNRFIDDETAIALGRALFSDVRLSGNGKVSCQTCHEPDRFYTDGLARSVGTGSVNRNAPTIVGSATQRWFYWDGRRDSLWAQALIPFEAENEMGSNRIRVLRLVGADPDYRRMYEAVFGPFPETVLDDSLPDDASPIGNSELRANWQRMDRDAQAMVSESYAKVGKAIAAFERTLQPPMTPFDRYAAALESGDTDGAASILTDDELAGARLFMDTGKTQCLQCHNGPMFTNGDFHNIGTGNFSGEHLDYGRVFGLRAVLMDEFNCLGPYSDAKPAQCTTLRFVNRDSHVPLEGAFKVPTLRGLEATAPYFHDGRFGSIREVLEYYNTPPDPATAGPHELRPLGLSELEIEQLEQFLLTLSQR